MERDSAVEFLVPPLLSTDSRRLADGFIDLGLELCGVREVLGVKKFPSWLDYGNSSKNHRTVILLDPVAQEVPEVVEAVIVVVPVPTKVANPGVVDENVTIDELPDVHVAELVTSTPFWVAVNCVFGVVARVKGPDGLMARV